MVSHHHPPTNHSDDRNIRLRQQIHTAFDQIALSLSCSLSALLLETQSRGLKDDDVQSILTVDEVESSSRGHSDMHLLCYRSNAGTLYVTRDTAAENDPVSTQEAFAERQQRHTENHPD